MYHSIEESCIGCGACVRICPVEAIQGEKKKLHVIDPKICIDCGSCGRVCPKGSVRGSAGLIVERYKKEQWLKPRIDEDECYACENCVAACPVDALAMKDDSLPHTHNCAVLSFGDKCISCRWCFDNCQFDAITMEVLSEVN